MASRTKELEFRLKNGAGKNNKVKLKNPGEGVSAETTKEVLDALIETNMFDDKGVDRYVTPVGAATVETIVEDIYVAE